MDIPFVWWDKEKIGIGIRQDILENLPRPVYLGLGSNVGNRIKNINKALKQISHLKQKA